MGVKIKINKVNFTLSINIAITEKRIVSGSFTMISSIINDAHCTSFTSAVIRVMMSPFRLSEKKETGKLSTFLYISLRISLRMPLRKTVIKNKAK